jgi:O-antigen/teichoic acid export membrane protein
VAARRQGLWTVVAITGLGVNVGLNLWAIPRWGHLGAAWATLVTEGVVLVLCLLVVRRIVDLRPDGRATVKILALGALVFAAGILVRSLPFLVAVGVCFTVFGLGAAVLRLFPSRLFQMHLWGNGERPA